MNEFECLKCGGELEFDDCLDEEFDGFRYRRVVYGHCEDCGTSHSWVEVYKFLENEELRIDEEQCQEVKLHKLYLYFLCGITP